MRSESAEPSVRIKVGDHVRALDGAYKGRIGTALRVVTSRDEGRTSHSILVSFPAGGADYLDTSVLEKAETSDE
jgi:hypothetical protein